MKVVSEFILRGGEPRKFMDKLVEAGVKENICLQAGFFDLTDFKIGELKEMCEERGIIYHEEKQSDVQHPDAEETLRVVALMKSAVLRKIWIYIHCLHGVDRTGWMVAAYRVIVEGVSVDDAIKEWDDAGRHKKAYFWWDDGFRKVMREIGAA